MRKLKYLSHLLLVTFIALAAATAPVRSMAQDDVSSDEETIVPQGSSSAGTPPVIIDESDSAAVNDVEEYDG